MKIFRSVAVGRRARGFTMVEMLVVMAIIAILALLAAPNFQDTIVRNEIKEALPLADIAKQPVALTWSMTQTAKLDLTRTEERGLTIGLNEFAGYAGVAIGGIATAYSLQTAILICAVPFLLSAILTAGQADGEFRYTPPAKP